MRRSRRGWRSGLGVALLAMPLACTAPGGALPDSTAGAVVIPALPLPASPTFRVDAAAIDALRCEECDDAARFFYGQLPMAAIDRLGAAPAPTDVPTLLGHLLVSGYGGGVYLRDALGNAAPPSPVAPVLDAIGRGTFVGLRSAVDGLVSLAGRGSETEVRLTAAVWTRLLAAVFGYNRGYLDELLRHPPAGVTDVEPVVCRSALDCRVASLPLPLLDDLDELAASVPVDIASAAATAVASGEAVWRRILATSSFTPEGYRSVVVLSGGFLQATEVALWATSAPDPATQRRGLQLAAGLITWAGSYFLGLASPLGPEAQPHFA